MNGRSPYEPLLQLSVQCRTGESSNRHLGGHDGTLRAAERESQQQQIPEDTVAEPADDGEEPSYGCVP